MNARQGVTLVELLVVMVILVTLAGLAVVSLEGSVAQSRYDGTARVFADLERAILDEPAARQPDGSRSYAGFLADMGRLPVVADSAAPCAELWTQPPGVLAFALRSPPAPDDDIALPCGWRGPYVTLPFGAESLADGWGRGFEVYNPTGAEAAVGETIAALASLGADGEEAGESFDRDLGLDFSARSRGALRVVVKCASDSAGSALRDPTLADGDRVVVRLFGPDASGDARVLGEALVDLMLLATGSEAAVDFVDVPVGPRVVRAWIDHVSGDGSLGSHAQDRRGRVARIELPRGGAVATVIVDVP